VMLVIREEQKHKALEPSSCNSRTIFYARTVSEHARCLGLAKFCRPPSIDSAGVALASFVRYEERCHPQLAFGDS
jgi:hypothetical protein